MGVLLIRVVGPVARYRASFCCCSPVCQASPFLCVVGNFLLWQLLEVFGSRGPCYVPRIILWPWNVKRPLKAERDRMRFLPGQIAKVGGLRLTRMSLGLPLKGLPPATLGSGSIPFEGWGGLGGDSAHPGIHETPKAGTPKEKSSAHVGFGSPPCQCA